MWWREYILKKHCNVKSGIARGGSNMHGYDDTGDAQGRVPDLQEGNQDAGAQNISKPLLK